MNTFLRRIPVLVACILCGIIVVAMCWEIIHQTHGLFVYPLDDTYIHLALARTLAFSHVWGIRSSEFASASSSPGWTLLLAVSDLVLGSHLITPLVLSLLFAFAILYLIDYAVTFFAPETRLSFRYVIIFVVLFVTPLPSLILVAMEHVAQTFSILALVIIAVQVLSLAPVAPVPRYKSALLLAVSFFAGTIRYEAVFAIAPIFFACSSAAAMLWPFRWL